MHLKAKIQSILFFSLIAIYCLSFAPISANASEFNAIDSTDFAIKDKISKSSQLSIAFEFNSEYDFSSPHKDFKAFSVFFRPVSEVKVELFSSYFRDYSELSLNFSGLKTSQIIFPFHYFW